MNPTTAPPDDDPNHGPPTDYDDPPRTPRVNHLDDGMTFYRHESDFWNQLLPRVGQ